MSEPIVHYAPYGRNANGTFSCGSKEGGYTGQPSQVTCQGCKDESPGLWPKSEPIPEAEVARYEKWANDAIPSCVGVALKKVCAAWRSLTEENERLRGWEEIARQHHHNECYYRGLVVKIGETLGEAAYISDDGSKQQDVLCAKVPELVAEQAAEIKRLNQELAGERMKDMNAETVRLATLDCMEERDKEQRAEIKCLVAAAEQNQKVIAEQAATIERMHKFSM